MDFIRTIASGKKRRLKESYYNLDLSYICPRIVAMSFPGSGVEIAYRNNIQQVSRFLIERHSEHFLTFNLSGFPYEKSKFQDQVVMVSNWEDHHSPPFNVIFELCNQMDQFLRNNDQNVVIVHCLAGKGRTGTLISCYLLFSNRFKDPNLALQYFAKKRFSQEGGVTGASQIRYVHYFYQILQSYIQEKPIQAPNIKFLTEIKIKDLPHYDKDIQSQYCLEIIDLSEKKIIYSTQNQSNQNKQFFKFQNNQLNEYTFYIQEPLIVQNDILIKLNSQSQLLRVSKLSTQVCRLQFNTTFLNEKQINLFSQLILPIDQLDPFKIQKNDSYSNQFQIQINFIDFCECNKFRKIQQKCELCQGQFEKDVFFNLRNNVGSQQLTSQTQIQLLFGEKYFDDYNEIIFFNGIQQNEKNNSISADILDDISECYSGQDQSISD